MLGRLQLKQSGQRGENKGGICLHPGLHTGPTRLRPGPGGPHPKSFFLFPVQPPESPILGALSIVSSPNISSHRRDPHDKTVNTSREMRFF